MADQLLIGNNTPSGTATGASSYCYFEKFQALNSGIIKNLNIYIRSGSGNVKAAVLSDNSDEPGAVLAQIGSTAVASNQWNLISISDINIIAGQYYWLACVCSAASMLGRFSAVGVERYKSVTFSTFVFEDNPSGLSSNARDYGLAGWGEVSAAGCPRQAMHMRRLM